MPFKPSLWDDSEPEYAPGLKLRKNRGTYFWAPPKKYRDAGYSIKTYTLDGTEGDGLDLDRARQCRALTRDMLEWYDGVMTAREPGTWGWLIGRYKADEFSDLQFVRPVTRAGYLKEIAKIENAIGSVLIEDTDYTRLMSWKSAMQKKGRSAHYIKKWFTHWGLVLSHGVKIGAPGCKEIKAIRSEMRVKMPPRRSAYITREQVNAIVAEADRQNLPHIALAVLLRFEFMLRGVDVYGQWEPAEGRKGGTQVNGRLWVDGLTWDMFDPALTRFEKVISKTRDSLPEPYVFDLTNTPDIRRRLMAIERRAGPVIVMQNGMPPKEGVITRNFKRIVRALGLPENLQIRDARSGGITEAKSLVDPYSLRDAAQHTQGTTTDIYVRGRSDSANNVVKIRNRKAT